VTAFRQVPEPPQWQKLAAKSIHLAFYLAMMMLPALGIVVLQASGKQLDLLGIARRGSSGEDKEFSKAVREIQQTIGNVMTGLIAFHVSAALWHHIVKRQYPAAHVAADAAGWMAVHARLRLMVFVTRPRRAIS
jgi:cytochrome b561